MKLTSRKWCNKVYRKCTKLGSTFFLATVIGLQWLTPQLIKYTTESPWLWQKQLGPATQRFWFQLLPWQWSPDNKTHTHDASPPFVTWELEMNLVFPWHRATTHVDWTPKEAKTQTNIQKQSSTNITESEQRWDKTGIQMKRVKDSSCISTGSNQQIVSRLQDGLAAKQ